MSWLQANTSGMVIAEQVKTLCTVVTLTLDGIARMSANSDYRNLYQAMVQARRFDTGSCSESCEIWGDQVELEFKEVGV